MKKSLRLISLLLVSVMILCSVPLSSSAASELDGKKILFFGDSITELGGTSRYTNLLQNMFPNSTIINAGVKGNSTYNARLRFDSDVLAKNPDIVFICFGMNDQAIQTDGTPVKSKDRYRTNIQNFITALHNIGADVVLMPPHPVCLATEPGRTDPNFRKGDLAGYCDILRELAMINNCGLVDMYTEFSLNYNSATYISDGLHQTAKGHQVYAEKIGAYLNAVYNGINKATLTAEYVTQNGNTIEKYNYIGANGANVKLMVPSLVGCTAVDISKNDILSTKTVTFAYNCELEDAIAKAKNANPLDYSESVLSEIRKVYNSAVSALSSGKSNAKELADLSNRLNNLLSSKFESELIVTEGVKYTTSVAPNYYFNNDQSDNRYCDDNVRLSDGSKSNASGENVAGVNRYSVWAGTPVDIVFDFGKAVSTNIYRGYFAAEAQNWGINAPSKFSVAYSADGKTYTSVGSTSSAKCVSDTDSWDLYTMTVNTNTAVNARYLKITVTPVGWGGKYIWADEIEAGLTVEAENDRMAIETAVFSGSYAVGEKCVVAKKNENGDYIITDVGVKESMYIDKDSIAIIPKTSSGNIKAGQQLILNGVNPDKKAVDILATFKTVDYDDGTDIPDDKPLGGDTSDDKPIDEDKPVDGDKPVDEPDKDFMLGDVNDNREIDSMDYILLKRAYFGTFALDEDAEKRADVNANGEIDAMDYILLKRAYFGTYTIQ